MKQAKQSASTVSLIAGVGMFLSTLDSGIINIAIPTFLKQFAAPISTVIWTVTLYTLFLSATILLFGRLADRVGCLKIYITGLALFALSSLLCGAATNIWMLIIFRALQGLSAAMMQATAIALITTRLEGPHIAKAMGILGMFIGLGPMLGPVLGGFILTIAGWRWLFWINIPICIVGIIGCRKLVAKQEVLQKKPINYLNLKLLAISMFCLLLTLNFISYAVEKFCLAAVITIILISTYLLFEQRTKHPIIPWKLFKSINFTAPMLGIIAFGGATVVAFMLPPIYLEKLRYFTAWQVGLISLSAPLGIVSASQISVRLVQKFGTLLPMLIGLSIMIFALICLTQITMDWRIIRLFLLLFCYGFGGGLYQPSCYINLTRQFPVNSQAFISALTRMIQNVAIAFAAGTVAMLIGLKTRHNLINGIAQGWWVVTIASIIAWIALLTAMVKSRRIDVIRI
ncbi:MAG: MFS transporter [Pseudomonadota bacterium]